MGNLLYQQVLGVLLAALISLVSARASAAPAVTTRSSLSRFHSGSLIQDLEARQNASGMKGTRLGQPHRTVVPFRGSVLGTLEPPSIQLLTQLTQCLTPTREWNALLFWLKKVRVTSDRRELLTDWRQSSGERTLFSIDRQTNLPRPLLSFQEQIRSDVISLQVIPSGTFILPTDSPQEESDRWVSIFKQIDSRQIERDSWSNEELDLLQEWIEIRDQTLRRSAECVQQALESSSSFELTGSVDSNRLKALKAWSVGRGTMASSNSLSEERREFSARAAVWLVHHLEVDDFEKLSASADVAASDSDYSFYYDALILTLVPRPNQMPWNAVAPSLWRLPIESIRPHLLVLESEGANHSREFRFDWLATYRDYRDIDQPAIPVHPMPAARAAKVAFIDTGVDWVEHPELGEFLGLGREGELQQLDFADGDQNSWAPATGDLAHGTGVMATLLTLIAHVDSKALEDRMIDLAMWKIGSLRSLVAIGSAPDLRLFDLRQETSFFEAFLKPALTVRMSRVRDGAVSERLPALGAVPDIVSVSALFPLQKYMHALGQPQILKQTPWIWVMAAGNEGREVGRSDGDSCMRDLPDSSRPSDQIVCVGSLKRGIIRDSVAAYSNYGVGVDLYTYDTYSGLCPSGTSCATPAISAALALLKSKFPHLSSRELKSILISSSQEKTLSLDSSADRRTVRVKVFDPLTMMNRAYINASRVSRGRSP